MRGTGGLNQTKMEWNAKKQEQESPSDMCLSTERRPLLNQRGGREEKTGLDVMKEYWRAGQRGRGHLRITGEESDLTGGKRRSITARSS